MEIYPGEAPIEQILKNQQSTKTRRPDHTLQRQIRTCQRTISRKQNFECIST